MHHVTRRADFQTPAARTASLALMDAYAADPMGDGRPLAAEVKARLAAGIAGFRLLRLGRDLPMLRSP